MIFISCAYALALSVAVHTLCTRCAFAHQWHIHTPSSVSSTILRCASNFCAAGSIIYTKQSPRLNRNCRIMYLATMFLQSYFLSRVDFHFLRSSAQCFCPSEWRWMRADLFPFSRNILYYIIMSLVVARDRRQRHCWRSECLFNALVERKKHFMAWFVCL